MRRVVFVIAFLALFSPVVFSQEAVQEAPKSEAPKSEAPKKPLKEADMEGYLDGSKIEMEVSAAAYGIDFSEIDYDPDDGGSDFRFYNRPIPGISWMIKRANSNRIKGSIGFTFLAGFNYKRYIRDAKRNGINPYVTLKTALLIYPAIGMGVEASYEQVFLFVEGGVFLVNFPYAAFGLGMHF